MSNAEDLQSSPNNIAVEEDRSSPGEASGDLCAVLSALSENLSGYAFIVDPESWSVIFSGGRPHSAGGYDEKLIEKLEWRIMEHLDSHRESGGEPLSFDYRPEGEDRVIEIRRSSVGWQNGGVVLLFLCVELPVRQAVESGTEDPAAYQPSASEEEYDDDETAKMLRECVREDFKGFSVFYQPRISLPGGRVTGAEALLRWQDPDGADVPPETFIPLAENLGLIFELGGFLLEDVCRLLGAVSKGGLPTFSVSVNVSVRQLRGYDFPEQLRSILEQTGADPINLIFDLPQSLDGDDTGILREVCEQLRGMGARIALDNFGAGPSPISNLHELPLDIIKIDRSLIGGVGRDRGAHALIRLISDYGRATGRLISMVGVETKSQLDYCHFVDADELQGFLFFQPMPQDALLGILPGIENGKPSADPKPK